MSSSRNAYTSPKVKRGFSILFTQASTSNNQLRPSRLSVFSLDTCLYCSTTLCGLWRLRLSIREIRPCQGTSDSSILHPTQPLLRALSDKGFLSSSCKPRRLFFSNGSVLAFQLEYLSAAVTEKICNRLVAFKLRDTGISAAGTIDVYSHPRLAHNADFLGAAYIAPCPCPVG